VAFRAGTTSAFYLGNIAAALQNLSPYVDNLSYPQSVAQLEVSAFGTNPKHFIPGLSDGDQITVSGPLDVTMWSHLHGLKAGQAAGSAAAAFIWGPGGSVASQARVAGSVFVAGISTSSGVGGRAEYSATLQVTVAVPAGTF
jgi:hypothetical protein